jgi:hypothetical protein
MIFPDVTFLSEIENTHKQAYTRTFVYYSLDFDLRNILITQDVQ